MKQPEVAFLFGPFMLIPSQRLLVRDHRPVKLGTRALDILHLLLKCAGEEVSKTALIEFAWPNVFVDQRNLKVHISGLRRALEDTFPQATYISTVMGHGYQFVGRVRSEPVDIADFSDTDPAVACSLPQPSPLIGRHQDVEYIARALGRTGLMTLVGPGGVGKTSLAIAVAHARLDDFPDGVCFVDLSTTDNPALVLQLIATGLGLRGDRMDLISAVEEHLQDRRILIVLDNCEHVLPAASMIAARLVEAKTSSRVLATSRAPLGIIGETLQRVEPLAFPPKTEGQLASQALAYPSIELFALRALETADYQLTDGDVPVVADICEALDGLPLAIEIVAAKLDQFSPEELLDSLSRSLGDLRNDDAGTCSRHRTLWAMLDWSYQLLSADEATIFQLLSVFTGSFEWPDVADMARLVLYDPYQTTVALGGLVAKSLVTAEIDGEQIRYRLLETVKSYAAERLLQDPLAREAQHHHAQLVLSLFEKSEAEWSWVDARVWHTRYGARIGDLRRALDWCFRGEGDASLGVEIAIFAIRLWNEQSSVCEQRSQVERALNYCASMTDAPKRTAALATSWAWSMTLARQLKAETDDTWNTALSFTELSGDVNQHLSAVFGKATFLIYTGRSEQAVSLVDGSIRIAQVGDRASLFDAERMLAFAEVHLGKLLSARGKLERLAAELGHGLPPSRVPRYQLQRYVGIYSSLTLSTWLTGQPEHALAMTEQMLLKTGNIGQLMGQSHILTLIAMPLALWSGKIDALDRYSTMLRSNLDHENLAIWEPVYRFYASVVRHVRGDLNAVDDMRWSVDELLRDRFLLRAPMYLGVLAEALLERGRSADADEAIEFALTLQRRTREDWCRPELLRVKAQTMAALGETDQVGVMLGRARQDAITIGAQTLELRIANDQAQMALTEGNDAQAAELLGPLYQSFGGGTATEDLKRSGRLLAKTGANRDQLPNRQPAHTVSGCV